MKNLNAFINVLTGNRWGGVYTPYNRFLKPNYADRQDTPRLLDQKMNMLKNAYSLAKTTSLMATSTQLTLNFINFGQFIANDIALTQQYTFDCSCNSASAECINIKIDENNCLPFKRNVDIYSKFKCHLKQREQG